MGSFQQTKMYFQKKHPKLAEEEVVFVLYVITYGTETLTLIIILRTQRAMGESYAGYRDIGLRDKVSNVIFREKTKVYEVLRRVASMKWR